MSDAPDHEPAREGISFFGPIADAPNLMASGVMSSPVIDPQLLPNAIELAAARGDAAKVLFHRDGPGGLSLVWVSFAPGYILPRHSHSADCLYYVVSGELRMGNRVVPAGSGFFVPEDAPYAYTAGPDGVVVLEFRTAGSFDMQITESAERWQRIVENAAERRDEWRGEWRDQVLPQK